MLDTLTYSQTLLIPVDGLDDNQRNQLTHAVEKALRQIKGTKRQLAPVRDLPVGEGWTLELVQLAVDRLREGGMDVQANAIEEALANGGSISRERIYALGKYPQDRMLRGFSRPINRVTHELKDEHRLPESAPNLLITWIEGGLLQKMTLPAEVNAAVQAA